MIFTTMDDVLTDMANAGVTAEEYDVQAIASEAYRWQIETNDRGQELLNSAGWRQVVSIEKFWEIVRFRRLRKEGES